MSVDLDNNPAPTFADEVRRLFNEHGGMASTRVIATEMVGLNTQLVIGHLWSKLERSIADVLTAKDAAGLPRAMSVNGSGTYVARTLFDVAQYKVAIERYVKLGSADINVARKLADECEAVHNVRIDVDEMIRQSAA